MVFEIQYIQEDMPKGFISSAIKHANTAEAALKLFAPKKPDRGGNTMTKRRAKVRILRVNEIPTKQQTQAVEAGKPASELPHL
jgi:hypothetical protein|tara:strand:+ start:1057 stop:1305 length:249 start_codon:yes stop_codon:yes gene_type:complete